MRCSRAWLIAVMLCVPSVGFSHDRDEDRETVHESGSSQPMKSARELKTLDDLKAEVMSLRKRVATLETLKPTLLSFMPDFAERFHVAHRAGDFGDWALAAHEIAEMQRMVGLVKYFNPKAGSMMNGFMTANLHALQEAVEKENRSAFAQALNETVKSCNACHQANGSALRVTLDVDDNLSMRHPHLLRKTNAPEEHTH